MSHERKWKNKPPVEDAGYAVDLIFWVFRAIAEDPLFFLFSHLLISILSFFRGIPSLCVA
jgi:hypothetical protein